MVSALPSHLHIWPSVSPLSRALHRGPRPWPPFPDSPWPLPLPASGALWSPGSPQLGPPGLWPLPCEGLCPNSTMRQDLGAGRIWLRAPPAPGPRAGQAPALHPCRARLARRLLPEPPTQAGAPAWNRDYATSGAVLLGAGDLALSLLPLGKWAGRSLKRYRAAFSGAAGAQVARKRDVLHGAVRRLSHWTGSPRCCQGGHRTWSRGPWHRNQGESCCSPFDSRAALSKGGRHPGHRGARPGGRGTSCPASRGPQPGAHPSQDGRRLVRTAAAGAAEPRRQRCLARRGGGGGAEPPQPGSSGTCLDAGQRAVGTHSEGPLPPCSLDSRRGTLWGDSGAWPATTTAPGAQATQSHLSLAVSWLRPCRQDASPRAGTPCALTRSEGLTSPSLSLKDMKPDLKSTSGVGTTTLAH